MIFKRSEPRNISTEIVFDEIRDNLPNQRSITVAVSLYNYARYIESCLNSILEQTHQHLDLIVVDDCSTSDKSVEVARNWLTNNSARFARTTLLKHCLNQGLAEARNTAFEFARTDPVFVIDADNQIYPRALERLFEFVKYHGFAAAYTQLEMFDEQKGIGLADMFSASRLASGNYVDAMALISRTAWKQVGGYSHMEGGWEDFDFWCKFVDHGLRAAFVPEMLCRYRVHGNSMLRTETNTMHKALKIELTIRHPWLDME